MSVWTGPDDTPVDQAIATCTEAPVVSAFWFDHQSQSWLQYISGAPEEVNTLKALNNLQPVFLRGGQAAPAPTPTPTPSPTPSPTPESASLPPPQEVGSISAGGNAVITISNDTPYTLTLEFQGPVSKSLSIPPCDDCSIYSFIGPIFCPSGRPEGSITLPPGEYSVTARVDDPSITPFAGAWTLEGDREYFHCFFIVRR